MFLSISFKTKLSFFFVCFFYQPPTTFAELMGGGEKKVWPVWEFFKWFLGLSSHTMAAIGKCFCFVYIKEKDIWKIDITTLSRI